MGGKLRQTIIEIKPQPVQERALASPADILLIGGAKGGGKSYTARLAPLRYIHVNGFQAAIFRRTLEQIKKPGGQWDKSFELYPYLGGKPNKSALKWAFPSGSAITFSHLKDPSDWMDWQGTETALYVFDQLEEFTQTQFLKILGCMRTVSGVPTQIICTMNPDADSWVRKLVDPWIASDGYVDPERDGKLYHFTVIDDEITYVDKDWRDANDQPPTSISYHSADIWDNPALLKADPRYLSNLMSQSLVDRERYLGIRGRGGNWNSRPVAGKMFRHDWFRFTDSVPVMKAGDRTVRFWDLASTEKDLRNDPDYTSGTKMSRHGDTYCVQNVIAQQLSPLAVDKLMLQTAQRDGHQCAIRWEQGHNDAAIRESARLVQMFTSLGYDAMGVRPYGDKVQRANAYSAAVEQGKVVYLGNAQKWQQHFMWLTGFPDANHDDEVDSDSGAFNELAVGIAGGGRFRN